MLLCFAVSLGVFLRAFFVISFLLLFVNDFMLFHPTRDTHMLTELGPALNLPGGTLGKSQGSVLVEVPPCSTALEIPPPDLTLGATWQAGRGRETLESDSPGFRSPTDTVLRTSARQRGLP